MCTVWVHQVCSTLGLAISFPSAASINVVTSHVVPSLLGNKRNAVTSVVAFLMRRAWLLWLAAILCILPCSGRDANVASSANAVFRPLLFDPTLYHTRCEFS